MRYDMNDEQMETDEDQAVQASQRLSIATRDALYFMISKHNEITAYLRALAEGRRTDDQVQATDFAVVFKLLDVCQSILLTAYDDEDKLSVADTVGLLRHALKLSHDPAYLNRSWKELSYELNLLLKKSTLPSLAAFSPERLCVLLKQKNDGLTFEEPLSDADFGPEITISETVERQILQSAMQPSAEERLMQQSQQLRRRHEQELEQVRSEALAQAKTEAENQARAALERQVEQVRSEALAQARTEVENQARAMYEGKLEQARLAAENQVRAAQETHEHELEQARTETENRLRETYEQEIRQLRSQAEAQSQANSQAQAQMEQELDRLREQLRQATEAAAPPAAVNQGPINPNPAGYAGSAPTGSGPVNPAGYPGGSAPAGQMPGQDQPAAKSF